MRKKIVRMLGGLGNRMFQYTYAEYLKTLGYDVQVDNYYPSKLKTEGFEWTQIFPNAPIDMPDKGVIWIYGGGYDIVSKVRRKLNLTYRYFDNQDPFHILTDAEIKTKSFLTGVFQNVTPALAIKEKIHEIFRFHDFKDERNIRLVTDLTGNESVTIHIRKGKDDYSKLEPYQHTCEADYYKSAINTVLSVKPKAKLYLFTDNMDWVHENLPEIISLCTIVDWNPSVGLGNHFDMQLMSLAKHNIIANSTYSWWGAFLNSNPQKMVIAPKVWFNPNSKFSKYANLSIPSDWITI